MAHKFWGRADGVFRLKKPSHRVQKRKYFDPMKSAETTIKY